MPLKLNFIAKYNYKPSKRTLLKIIVLGGIMVYMIYHLLQGNRGLLALLDMKQIVKKEQEILTNLEREQKILYRRIKLLRPQSLDLDLLDESVRDILNFAHEDEVIIETKEVLTFEDKIF